MITFTVTPRRAASVSAATNCCATTPSSKMKVSKLMRSRAFAIASSMAGKISSPFCRRSKVFPCETGDPVSAAR